MKIVYIAETSLTNQSAYSQHVIKMCDAFGQRSCDLTLVVPKEKNNLTFKKIKRNFLLNSKKPFVIKSMLRGKINNFFTRFMFAIKASIFTKAQKPDLVVTRSLLSSFFLSIIKISHFLEIHNEIKSFSKFLFLDLNFINSKYIKRIILISNSLSKKFDIDKNKILILHDGVDNKNFYKFNKIKSIKTATYVGSFYDGRGIKIIENLANKFKMIDFKLYGKKKRITNKLKNISFFSHISYDKVPAILAKSDLLLMPYADNVSVRAKGLNTASYCSPLKMFDYLASGKVIVSSKLDGICEVLKHKKNAIIVKKYTLKNWSETFNDLLNHKYNLIKIQNGSVKTAKKYSWNQRVLKIIEANKK
jgi:glycosyltransferase involved in cell wall biosynthesis